MMCATPVSTTPSAWRAANRLSRVMPRPATGPATEPCRLSGRGRYVALGLDVLVVEQERLHPVGQEFPRLGVGQAQVVFIDQPGLDVQPFCPGVARNFAPDAYPQFAGIGGIVQTLR